MAILPLNFARRHLQAAQFRNSSEFEQAVEAAMVVAQGQPFCSPLDYALSRSRNGSSPTREVTTWREVHARLQRSRPEPAAPADKSDIEPQKTAEPVAEEAGDMVKFAVGLLTDVGPGSPAALLSVWASEKRAGVEVVTTGDEPLLIYTAPLHLVGPELEGLRYTP